MIRIVKPTAPLVLITQGQAAAQDHCADYDNHPTEYRKGTKTFDFDPAVYAHDDVKETLRTAQHDKCAFCESKVTHIAYGDIEHFRPKAGYRQRTTDRLKRPGYYWLAYTWENLFFSCQLCNQRYKRNLFPLRAPKHRARSHRGDMSREEPLFLDPARDDLGQHITFANELVKAKRRSPKGTATIAALGLNRPALVVRRSQWLAVLKALVKLRRALERKPRPYSAQDQQAIAECEAILAAAIRADAEYAAMARAFLS